MALKPTSPSLNINETAQTHQFKCFPGGPLIALLKMDECVIVQEMW